MDGLPRWVRTHRDYYGSRFTEAHYRTWDQILCGQMGGDGELLLKAVQGMIIDCFKGYVEDHLSYLKSYVSKHAPPCERCNNRGVVEVTNYGPRRDKYPRIGFLCECARGIKARAAHPDGATISQYEERRADELSSEARRRTLGEFVGKLVPA
jgi:hypothetical protein